METNNIKIDTFRLNNAGENIEFIEKLVQIGKNINVEFPASNMPQQNGIAERAFATLHGRVRTIMNYAYLKATYVRSHGHNVQK